MKPFEKSKGFVFLLGTTNFFFFIIIKSLSISSQIGFRNIYFFDDLRNRLGSFSYWARDQTVQTGKIPFVE